MTGRDDRFCANLPYGPTIGSVAFDVGFGDLSYFNRTFRRRYGAAPTEIRQSAMKADPSA
jgi:AraC-like DNA-binding protein